MVGDFYIYFIIIIIIFCWWWWWWRGWGMCRWCNGYQHWKWNQSVEFKFWPGLLRSLLHSCPWENAQFYSPFPSYGLNSRVGGGFLTSGGNHSRRRKTLNSIPNCGEGNGKPPPLSFPKKACQFSKEIIEKKESVEGHDCLCSERT